MKDLADAKNILCTCRATYKVVGTLKISQAKSIIIVVEKFNMSDENPKVHR